MPAHKKHPSTRARRNKTAGAATLPARQLSVVPDPVEYADLKVAELRARIDERNGDGRPDSKRISKRGTKAELAAALQADDARRDGPPDLPDRPDGWTQATEKWWADVWSSPMSSEWDDSDLHNLYLCAALYDDMWTATTPKARKEAAGEFRLQRASLGLDPYSRRRLEWQIEATDEAQDKGKQRRSRQPAEPAGEPKKRGADPRAAFTAN